MAGPGTRCARPAALPAIVRSLAPLGLSIGAALALHFLVVPAVGPFYGKVMLDMGINVILAVSLNIVNGYTGQFSIGHAGFMALGGYTAGLITYYGSFLLLGSAARHGGFLGAGEWLFVSGCLAGGLVASGAGYLVGLPSLRLRGDYLAIVTLGFGEIVRVTLQRSGDVLTDPVLIARTPPHRLLTCVGGALGFSGLPFYTSPFWVCVLAGVTLVVAYRLKVSTYGRAFLAIRENQIAAEAMGVPSTRFKVRAFVIAAFFAGIAGGLYAHEVGTTLNPRELAFLKSIDILIMVVLGGLGSISGAVIAALGLTILPELLRSPPHVWPAALLAIGVVLGLGRRRGLRPALVLAAVAAGLEAARALALARGVNLAEYRMILYALSLVLVMILRPQGLLGVHEIWDRELWRSWIGAPAPARRRTP